MRCGRRPIGAFLNIDAIKRRLAERDERRLVWFLYMQLRASRRIDASWRDVVCAR